MIIASSTSQATDENRIGDLVLTDFTDATADLGWYVVNDTVMGGRSDGDFQTAPYGLHFTGRTNTNGGGFSSIRANPLQANLFGYSGIRVTIKGDGRRYTWRLTTDARWRGRTVSYWADFDTVKGEWSTADIPFSNFVPRFRGYQLEGLPLNTRQITGMGLMIYDNQNGPFDLQLGSVSAYAAENSIDLLQYRWKKRVLILSAESDDDPMLKEQLHEVASTESEFESRDLVIVTLFGRPDASVSGQSVAGNAALEARQALGISGESFSLRLIGKDGSVKLARERLTPMAEIYALIDTMPMRRVEQAPKR